MGFVLPHQPKILALILAGGKGERLRPLTDVRSKPAVPFGGTYRIIDFVLSNFYNSGIMGMHVMVQYLSQSLIEHLRRAWRIGDGDRQFVTVVPPQMRARGGWYAGTADAVYQNLNLIQDVNPDIVAVFGADHVYRMDIRQMVEFHYAREADVSMATLPVPLSLGGSFGILQLDQNNQIIGFDEKPQSPQSMPEDPTRALSSTGNYLFRTDILVKALEEDAKKEGTHDFGRDIIPCLMKTARVQSYNFYENEIPGCKSYEEEGYWRDVGTVTAYWKANMDLLGISPRYDLRNREWPIRTEPSHGPPASLVNCYVDNAVIGEGTCAVDANIRRSVIGRNVQIEPGAVIEDSVIFDDTQVGARSHLTCVIVDRNNKIPAGVEIGQGTTTSGAIPLGSNPIVLPKPRAQQAEHSSGSKIG
jgi:glucose-1-phosphate adenylyltransferase